MAHTVRARRVWSWFLLPGLALSSAALSSTVASAQPADPADPPAEEPTAAPGVDPTPPPSVEEPPPPPEETTGDSTVPPPPVPQGSDSEVADARAGDSAVELPGKTYYFVGLRYRTIIVPKFMVNLFGDGGRTVVVHSGGPEFAIRKDGFEYNFGLWFANYAMDDTPFKSTSDGEKAWEIVNSKMKAIYITSDFLWSQEFSPAFSLNYGAGVGLGFMFGDLNRVQAYPRAGSAGNPEDYERCSGPGTPDPNFCGTDNDHYGDYNEPSWADGGSKPIVFPWLALQTGLRFKPAKSFVARLDLGFGTSGFFVGLGADYGL
ncbi:MAG: hypothetical protein H6718_35760 [Polyangiaceae bacterium]|nr:hypothetical protein [Myxococcales bacterium]MCB9590820.1 hypothetical protein [Polyangiaceae bacterium]